MKKWNNQCNYYNKLQTTECYVKNQKLTYETVRSVVKIFWKIWTY